MTKTFDVTSIVHYLRPNADVFIMGSGGGRDILTALAFEQSSVTGIELNGDILNVANERFGDFTGHLDERPDVRTISGEARSYLASSDESYDIIQISLIDTWAATAAGAFALSENALYTVEAFDVFLDRLTPGGVLSVSHWYVNDQPTSSYRLTSLAAASLREAGFVNPEAHLMFVRSPGEHDFFPSVGTILVSNEPFDAVDVREMEEMTERLEFKLLLAPGVAGDPTFTAIAAAEDPTSGLQRLAVVGLGLAELALVPQQNAHVVDRFQRVRVVVAEDPTSALQRLAEVGVGLGELALVE